MAKKTEIDPHSGTKDLAGVATPFRRMLVATDESPSAEAAVGLVAEWVDGPGAEVRFLHVTEERGPRRPEKNDAAPHQLVVGAPTLGARNRQLVHGIAEAAEAFGADVIVLGFDRARLNGHRLAPSLRDQIMRATELPVLVAPSPQAGDKQHHRPGVHDGERAHSAHRDVRV